MPIAPRPSSQSILRPKILRLRIEECPAELRDKIEFRVARLEELDIPAEKFDLALLSWSL